MNIYLVSSGDYSDYTIHCAFECEEDCRSYVRQFNENALRSEHNYRVEIDYTPPNEWLKCVGDVADCPLCGKSYEDLDSWEVYMEELQFFPAGEIPIRLPDSIRASE